MATAHVLGRRDAEHPGITTLISILLTFSLGALAAIGSMVSAVTATVVAMLLLGLKPWVKRSVSQLEEVELHATLKLLLITVVLLPILPDRGFGPSGALNPYEIWWMVVMIAAISFSGYFAVKAMGEGKGVLLTSVFAGLASSTSLTLNFARLARQTRARVDLFAAGILLASATLFPRILVIAAVFNIDLALALVAPLGAMALVVLGPAAVVWLRRERNGDTAELQLHNPLELGAALRFGALLAIVLALSRLLSDAYGDMGLLAVGAVSGLVDLNAITLSVARMAEDGVVTAVAVATIVVASVSNGLFKAVLSLVAGTPALALRIGVPMVGAAVAGLVALWLGGHWPLG
jgi:uncharacterized membrane protein (DUF4010 family)